jgi:hypothetical protein
VGGGSQRLPQADQRGVVGVVGAASLPQRAAQLGVYCGEKAMRKTEAVQQ